MKTRIIKMIFSGILVFILLFAFGCEKKAQEDLKENRFLGTITMSGAWALYPMAVKWAEEFQKIHPEVKIDVAAGGAGKGMADSLTRIVDIGMVSRDIYPAEIENGAWWVSVTREYIKGVIS